MRFRERPPTLLGLASGTVVVVALGIAWAALVRRALADLDPVVTAMMAAPAGAALGILTLLIAGTAGPGRPGRDRRQPPGQPTVSAHDIGRGSFGHDGVRTGSRFALTCRPPSPRTTAFPRKAPAPSGISLADGPGVISNLRTRRSDTLGLAAVWAGVAVFSMTCWWGAWLGLSALAGAMDRDIVLVMAQQAGLASAALGATMTLWTLVHAARTPLPARRPSGRR